MLAFSMVGILRSKHRVAAWQKRRNLRARATLDAIRGGTARKPYFVYLRPFDIDGKFVRAPRSRATHAYVEEYGWPTIYHDLESALALLVYEMGELVALSDKAGTAGAGYVRSTDATWREDVRDLCAHAAGIFLVPFGFEGTAWEVQMLVGQGLLPKVFAVMPAVLMHRRWKLFTRVTRDYRALWEAGRARYVELRLPEYDPAGGIVTFVEGIQLLKGFGNPSDSDNERERDLELLRARLASAASAACAPGRGSNSTTS